MALYIMLSTLSERGRQVVKKLPGSIRKVGAGPADEAVTALLSRGSSDSAHRL